MLRREGGREERGPEVAAAAAATAASAASAAAAACCPPLSRPLTSPRLPRLLSRPQAIGRALGFPARIDDRALEAALASTIADLPFLAGRWVAPLPPGFAAATAALEGPLPCFQGVSCSLPAQPPSPPGTRSLGGLRGGRLGSLVIRHTGDGVPLRVAAAPDVELSCMGGAWLGAGQQGTVSRPPTPWYLEPLEVGPR